MEFVWPVNTSKDINDDELKSVTETELQVPEYAFSKNPNTTNTYLRYTPLTENTFHRRRPRAGTMPTSSPFEVYNSSLEVDDHPNSLTSTLASLGLTDDNSSLSSTLTRHYFESVTRNRSYTVSDPFKPFEQVVRPRASSLGMAELSQPQFSPFDFDYLQPFENTNKEGSIKTDSSSLYSQKIKENELEKKKDEDDDHDSSTQQTPSRALWLGNISPSIKVSDLFQMFSSYGHIESARILSDKDCAFINFESVKSALAAKKDLETRLGSKVGGSVVKVGFGKADVNLAVALTNEASPNVQGPTRALWVGNIPTNTSSHVLQPIFESFGPVETIRILSHKNCAFINFHRQEDAVRARKMLQNKEILGPGGGTVRVGFAREPQNEDVTPLGKSKHQENAAKLSAILSAVNKEIQVQLMNDGSEESHYKFLALERELIMQQLGHTIQSTKERVPVQYYASMPPVPEFNTDRKVRPLRLREIKKGLDNGLLLTEIESIAQECMEEIVELCSGKSKNMCGMNELDNEDTKLLLLQIIAPYLASIGIHKNGTWAAQKIIDLAHTEEQVELICSHLSPCVPLLLLDSFGNYVVQRCLRMGYPRNQFIFDGIVDNCLVIGQGRFGSRSIRTIIGSPLVTKEQQIYVASAIIQNSMLLSINPNGCILLNWLLDSSKLLDQVSHVHSN
ncbi:hypothetical protein G6F47_003374 [Rhizopus delemar]|nr:hypothetical protein G6F48_004416 [Rhizopus delemar]KAG1601777.1 hypothetical protein G6F47_003374 [Rhizopus delemar]